MGWTIIAVGFITWFVLVLFFTPRIDYRVAQPLRPDSEDFLHVIQITCQATIHSRNKVEIFNNGGQFYPAMREAILAAGSKSASRWMPLEARSCSARRCAGSVPRGAR